MHSNKCNKLKINLLFDLMASFQNNVGISRHQKNIPDFNKARDDRVAVTPVIHMQIIFTLLKCQCIITQFFYRLDALLL